MYNLLMKNGQVMAFGLGVAVVLIFLFMMFGGVPDENNAGLGFGLIASFVFIGVCALAAAGFAVYQNLGNIKGLIPSALALVAVIAGIVKFIGFIQQTTVAVVDKTTLLENGLTSGEDSLVGIGVTIGLAAMALTFLVLIVSLVMDFFKG